MKRLILVGGGHAHAQVLRDWPRVQLRDAEVLIISPIASAPYSGMVPGWLAGDYAYDDICIDFDRLARAAGAKLVLDDLVDLDPNRRTIRLASGASLSYDVLSLNVGSTLQFSEIEGKANLPLRPLSELRTTWDQLLSDSQWLNAKGTTTVYAAGGGAAGIEAILAVVSRLRAICPNRMIRGKLYSRSGRLLPTSGRRAAAALERRLRSVGIEPIDNTAFDPSHASSEDLVIWATGARAHAWQANCGLAVSQQGFIQVNGLLQSTSHSQVYAVGDCAQFSTPLPKAGVVAVRMGPVLLQNLRAALGYGSAVPYVPQKRWLEILAANSSFAVASWGPITVTGRLVRRWKERIDRNFIRSMSPGAGLP